MNKLECPLCKRKIGYQVIKKHYSQCKEKYIQHYTEEMRKQQQKEKYSKLNELIKSSREDNPLTISNKLRKNTTIKEYYRINEQRSNKEQQRSDKEQQRSDKEQQRGNKEQQRSNKEQQRSDKEQQRGNKEQQRSDKEQQRGNKEQQRSNKEPPNISTDLINITSNKIIKHNLNLYYLYSHSNINLKYDNAFNKYLNNKMVVLVGPASTLHNSKKGNTINSFDIVVRLNKSLPLPKKRFEDIGNRTDILYNSLNTTDFPGENIISEYFYKRNDIKFLCCPYPNKKPFNSDIRYYLDRSRGVIPFKIMNDNTFNNIQNIIGTRPNTGLCAIVDLLKTDLKYLYITGINFYKTMYYKEYRNVSNSDIPIIFNQNHNQEPQINLLRYLSLIDDRIILDNELNAILYKEYHQFFKTKHKIDNILHDPFVNSKNQTNLFHKLNKYSKIIFIGSGNSVIDVSAYDMVICYSMKNITNYNNKHIICFEYDNNYIYSDTFKIKGVININSQTILSDTPIYNISKNYYVNINKALSRLGLNITLDIFIILALHRYCKFKTDNLNIIYKSPNYLLYKYMKHANIIL